MARYSYALGTTATTTNLEDLPTPVNPPRGRYYEASIFNDRADGLVSGHGFPYVVWTFDVLTAAMLGQLRSFCSGQSAEVYLVTRLAPDATYAYERFAKFSGVMLWPSREQMDRRNNNGRYLGLEFTFRHLASVELYQLEFYQAENSGLIIAI